MLGHHQVGEHEVEFFAGIQQGESFHAGGGLPGLIVGSGQHGADDFADGFFVVNDQDALGWHRLSQCTANCSKLESLDQDPNSEVPKVITGHGKAHWPRAQACY